MTSGGRKQSARQTGAVEAVYVARAAYMAAFAAVKRYVDDESPPNADALGDILFQLEGGLDLLERGLKK